MSQTWRRQCAVYASLALALLLGATASRADVIYQAFNERFVSIETKLDRLRDLGYSAVQVSPAVKSADNQIWWARYQPLDYRVIEGPLGNEAELRHLIAATHEHGLKLMLDVVLNHMADTQYTGGVLQYPEFSPRDFHDPDHRPCIQNYDDRYQVTHFWLCDANAHLPDLDTSSAYVRGIHKAYLQRLLAMGIDGFRLDAVKHIEPEYFAEVMQVVPHDKLVYGEVIGNSIAESELYTKYMQVTDFHLLRVMLGAFSLGGDLRDLTDPESFGGALPADEAVVFSRNHDTAMHSDFFNFGDYQDAMLANAFVIGRGLGHAMVYRDDFATPEVTGALAFRRSMHGQGVFVRKLEDVCAAAQGCDPQTLLVVERGNQGVMLINKSGNWIDAGAARFPGLSEGCYRESRTGFGVTMKKGGDGQTWVSAWGSPQRGGLNIGPRTVLFFARAGDGSCT